MIIGLGHRKCVGKDTIACHLETIFKNKNVACQRLSFARELKLLTYQLYKWAGIREPDFYDQYPEEKATHYININMTYRDLLIKVGMALREVYPDTWVYPVLEKAKEFNGISIITDVRFPNEMAAIKNTEYHCLVHVKRPSEPETDDAADLGLVGYEGAWDRSFINDVPKDDLYDKVFREIAVPLILEWSL